jgi:hypothetical protein
MRQIMGAVMMYTHDNHDLFPPNEDSLAPLGHNWVQGNVAPGGSARFSPDILADPQRCLLTSYVNSNASIFRCTADLTTGNYTGTNPALFGKRVPIARSVVMNQAVGTICPGISSSSGHAGIPTLSAHGPWLSGTFNHRRNSPWRTYGKVSETIIPGPAKLWVFIEEDRFSINDGAFAFNVQTPEWIDFPSTLHNMAGVIGFADGRVELHKWVNQSTVVSGGIVTRRSISGDNFDWQWLAERTSARAQ